MIGSKISSGVKSTSCTLTQVMIGYNIFFGELSQTMFQKPEKTLKYLDGRNTMPPQSTEEGWATNISQRRSGEKLRNTILERIYINHLFKKTPQTFSFCVRNAALPEL